MGKGASSSRRQRRGQFKAAGYLQIKNMFGRFSGEGEAWYGKIQEDGKQSHEANMNKMHDRLENEMQTKLNIAKESWKNIGYNEEEVKMLEEAWLLDAVKVKETYREDKKEAKKLRKEANLSLNSRKNANG
ncbi:hypothetical protein N8Z10_00500 [bacterium]|nr:hypothetical protein [bacterium]